MFNSTGAVNFTRNLGWIVNRNCSANSIHLLLEPNICGIESTDQVYENE